MRIGTKVVACYGGEDTRGMTGRVVEVYPLWNGVCVQWDKTKGPKSRNPRGGLRTWVKETSVKRR